MLACIGLALAGGLTHFSSAAFTKAGISGSVFLADMFHSLRLSE